MAVSFGPVVHVEDWCLTWAIGKVYVQDLIWERRKELAPLILEKRAYIYICGDARSMAKSVEERLAHMLADAKGGSPELEGVKEVKLLKDRNVSANESGSVLNVADRLLQRLMSDVWS